MSQVPQVGEGPGLDLGALLQLGHLQRLEAVEVLEVALDDEVDRVGRHVQVLQVPELGPGRREAEAKVRDLVVGDVQGDERRLVQDLLVEDGDGVVREVQVSQERRLQDRDGHDAGAGHVQTSDSLGLV